MIKKNRRWLLLISMPAIIGFLIIFFYNISGTSEQVTPRYPQPIWFRDGYRRVPIHNIFLSPMLLIIAIIPISYYFISKELEERLERNLNIIVKLVKKNNSVSNKSQIEIDEKNIILRFLNHGERKVVEKLIEKKGDILQSEISRIEGMNKLKTHRAVRDLERKGIIKREGYGKTHLIILSKDIKEAMLK